MRISEADIQLVKRNRSQFVSLKYLDDEGVIKQIDASLDSIEEGNAYINSSKLDLVPIEGKGFVDPFRSFPTTSFFCENIADKNNPRTLATKLYQGSKTKPQILLEAEWQFPPVIQRSTKCDVGIQNPKGSEAHPEGQRSSKNNIKLDPYVGLRPPLDDGWEFLAAEFSFWIPEENFNNSRFTADPDDIHSNLRSDIVATLEKINIKTTAHFHGTTAAESVIGIRGNDPIDLEDNLLISKFIIQNIVSSYGLSVKFSCPPTPNLTLIFQASKATIDKITSTINNSDFEVTELDKIIDTKITLNARLLRKLSFIPYVSFVKLLS